jgi:hypothetical protein
VYWRHIIYCTMKCVLWFSPQILFETFLIIRRTERDTIKKMCIGLHVKYPLFLSDINETWIFSKHLRKILKHQISWKFVQWEHSCSMGTDGQTDGQTWRNQKSLFAILWTRTKLALFVSDFSETWMFLTYFRKTVIIKFHANRSSGNWVVLYRHTNRQTWQR